MSVGEAAWAELAELHHDSSSSALIDSQGNELNKGSVVRLDVSTSSGRAFPCIVVYLIYFMNNDCYERETNDAEQQSSSIFVHPLIYECLSQITIASADESSSSSCGRRNKGLVEVNPLPMPTYLEYYSIRDICYCQIEKIKSVQDLPDDSKIILQILYHDEDNSDWIEINDGNEAIKMDHETIRMRVSTMMHGRLVFPNSFILLPLSANCYMMAVVQEIVLGVGSTNTDTTTTNVAYRIMDSSMHSFEIIPNQHFLHQSTNDIQQPAQQEPSKTIEVSGYESQINLLLQLIQLQLLEQVNNNDSNNVPQASPTGILLTGCAGVGKSTVAQCVAARLQQQADTNVIISHFVSVQDLVLQASWATDELLLDILLQPYRGKAIRRADGDKKNVFLILDDLDALATMDGEDLGMERRLVTNAILQAIDTMVQKGNPVLGIGQNPYLLPPELVKIGRLEKEIIIYPPTQKQREQILVHMIKSNASSQNQTKTNAWAESLATMTAGCVAADLLRLCTDAYTKALAREHTDNNDDDDDIKWIDIDNDNLHLPFPELSWEDLLEAAQNCVPSQLAALDVIKPPTFDKYPLNDWSDIHAASWRHFAGYQSIKKRLYRTVVIPWRRTLTIEDSPDTTVVSNNNNNNNNNKGMIAPPSGVLFHGDSGCGKSMAAACLGASLGLPMIKVGAADVLDKWLGGSEAAIRSLFERARAAAPCILFFDEIDAIACNRSSGDDGSTDVMSRLLSTLLNEMDGVSSGKLEHTSRVLVVACTNRLDTLDAALLRAGRLEEHILLSKPSVEDAECIIQNCFVKVPLGQEMHIQNVAKELVDKGATSAEIEGVCREAVFQALRRLSNGSEKVSISYEDIRKAIILLKL